MLKAFDWDKPYPAIESRTTNQVIKVIFESFGYHHGEPPDADVVIDIRHMLRNPARDASLRELTGLEPQVAEHVLATSGAWEVEQGLYILTHAVIVARSHAKPSTMTRIAIGCAGGRHRSVVLANQLMHRLMRDGIGADVSHRDVLRPVVENS